MNHELYILRKVAKLLNFKERLAYANGIFNSKLLYGAMLMAGQSKHFLKKLTTLQNTA